MRITANYHDEALSRPASHGARLSVDRRRVRFERAVAHVAIIGVDHSPLYTGRDDRDAGLGRLCRGPGARSSAGSVHGNLRSDVVAGIRMRSESRTAPLLQESFDALAELRFAWIHRGWHNPFTAAAGFCRFGSCSAGLIGLIDLEPSAIEIPTS